MPCGHLSQFETRESAAGVDREPIGFPVNPAIGRIGLLEMRFLLGRAGDDEADENDIVS